MAVEISAILSLKVSFWKEVAQEEPKLKEMQHSGLQVVERMYELNRFYCLKVRVYEEELNCFHATSLYATFLISSTSFKDYAKSILKQTSKFIENADSRLDQNSAF